MARGAGQDKFLGALMGMAIGDAMGMPVAGWSAGKIAERYGRIDSFYPRVFADGTEIKAGEFTDESEIALCIVESLTVNDGVVDPDNIGARLLHLVRGEAKRWMQPDTIAALEIADERLEFQVPVRDDAPSTPDVASRGIAIGLLHAVGTLDEQALRIDSETVTRLTHGSPVAIAATTAVAFVVQAAGRGVEPRHWLDDSARFVGGGSVAESLAAMSVGRVTSDESTAATVAEAIAIVVAAPDLPSAIAEAVNHGGWSDARGAIAGALAGARWGIAGVPQRTIDELEGRIYVSLAAPWFHRTALRRAGLVIDLRSEH